MDAFNLPCYLYASNARDNIKTCLNDEALLQIKQGEDISLVNNTG